MECTTTSFHTGDTISRNCSQIASSDVWSGAPERSNAPNIHNSAKTFKLAEDGVFRDVQGYDIYGMDANLWMRGGQNGALIHPVALSICQDAANVVWEWGEDDYLRLPSEIESHKLLAFMYGGVEKIPNSEWQRAR